MSTNPLAVAAQSVAVKWKNAQNDHAIDPRVKSKTQSISKSPHKRAKSMKAAYSLPNMGIVRLNKLGLTENDELSHRRKSGAELNLPGQLAKEHFVVSVTSADDNEKENGSAPQFSEENNWD